MTAKCLAWKNMALEENESVREPFGLDEKLRRCGWWIS